MAGKIKAKIKLRKENLTEVEKGLA